MPALSTEFLSPTTHTSQPEVIEKKSLILKTEAFLDGFTKNVRKMSEVNLFDCEIRMYSETLPEIARLLKSIGVNEKFTPKLIYYSNQPAQVIIFEDISVKGFETSKTFGVNYELSKLAFDRLGQFHAASMILDSKNMNVSNYNNSVFHMNVGGQGYYKFVQSSVGLLEELKNWPGYEIYVQKLGKLIENHYEKEKITFTPNKTGYNVLNHGDFHSKNMMFRNMDLENPEVIMLDFQVCFYGTPAIDLIQAKYSLTNSDRKDELIESYYQHFSDTLEKLEYSGNIPSIQNLKDELYRNRFFDVMLSIFLVPFNFIDVASVNMEHLFGPDDDGDYIRRAFYTNLEVQDALKEMLPVFLEKGYYDEY